MGEPDGLERLEAALRSAGELWSIVDDNHNLTLFGDNLLGHTAKTVHSSELARFVHPDDLSTLSECVDSLRSNQTVEAAVLWLRALDADGGWHWTELSVMDRRGDPAVGGVVSRIRPLSESEAAFAAATGHATVAPPRTSAAGASGIPGSEHPGDSNWPRRPSVDDSLASLAEVVPAAILTTDVRGNVVYTNQELRRLHRGSVRDLAGFGWRNLIHPDDLDDVARTSAAALRGERGDILFRIIDQDDARWLHGRLAPMRAAGRIVGMVGVLDDVTSQREHEAALAHQATHDPLTGLPNRVLLRDRLSQALGRISRTGEPVAALFIDLDRFKSVNDLQGHSIGDEVLVEVARRMLVVVRPTDTVARLGGDEFMVVCEGLGEESVVTFCERLGSRVAEPIATSDGEVSLTGAIGIAMVTGPATVDETIHQADAAMYRAKRAGAGAIALHHVS